MAFVTVLSDLFSCGRARKTRQPSIGPLDDNDATSEPNAGETAEAATPTLGLALESIPALTLDEKATRESDARPRTGGYEADHIRNTQQRDVQPSANQHHDSAAEETIEMSVVHEKAKPSAGWMVEQRVIVTAMPAAAPKEAEKTASVPEPEPETNTVTPPVRCTTPELEPWISTSITRSETPEPVPEPEVSAAVRPVTPEAQIVDVVSVRSATPDIVVRLVTPQEQPVDVASVQNVTPEVESVVQPAMTEPEVTLPATEEIATPVPEPKVVAPKVQAAKRTTPLTFLSMPPGVYSSLDSVIQTR